VPDDRRHPANNKEHSMQSTAQDFATEEQYWRDAHCFEAYWREGFDFEDFAPAYCVGSIGYAQYGGNYEDAEKCLSANWMRIKGDSRLPYEVASLAMRAAWDRMAKRRERETVRRPIGRKLLQLGLRMPSFKLNPALMR
jgi:hypothetical protein